MDTHDNLISRLITTSSKTFNTIKKNKKNPAFFRLYPFFLQCGNTVWERDDNLLLCIPLHCHSKFPSPPLPYHMPEQYKQNKGSVKVHKKHTRDKITRTRITLCNASNRVHTFMTASNMIMTKNIMKFRHSVTYF